MHPEGNNARGGIKMSIKICIFGVAVLSLFIFAACNGDLSDAPLEKSTGQIFLYGERHGVEQIMDRKLELWSEYYHNHGMRHLFVELGYFSAEFLNVWMQSNNDDILYELFNDWIGTFLHVPHTLVFFRTIKSEFPETIFHGTDVGHQYHSTGIRFLQYLRDNNLQDSEQYLLTQEAIEQGERYYSDFDLEFRVTTKTENFIRAFDRLIDQNVMGILYGSAHTNFGYMSEHGFPDVSTMAERLRERYGDALHTEDLTWLVPSIEEIITINNVDYEASYFGTNTNAFSTPSGEIIVSRSFWRLENAYDDFKDNPVTGDILPVANLPMQIDINQVFVVDFEMSDGSVRREFYRSDGNYWEGMAIVNGFRPLIIDAVRIDVITINETDYEASYFGTDTTVFGDVVSRSFWRLENAYDDFKDNPTTNDVWPFSVFPMLIEVGQVFILEVKWTDGSTTRFFNRSDGNYYQGIPITNDFSVD